MAEVEAGHFRAALREGQRNVTGAAADVERTLTGPDGGQFNDVMLPAPVEAEALQVVEQIISPGNGGEEVADLCGALFARGVKDVAHGHSLAEGLAPKSKPINCALR